MSSVEAGRLGRHVSVELSLGGEASTGVASPTILVLPTGAAHVKRGLRLTESLTA